SVAPPPGSAPGGAIVAGSAVVVTWPDGRSYAATVDQVAPDQAHIHCTFTSGERGWYPANAVRLA
ncbi:MAG: hypothetical protein KAI47_04415, partial [Deltaproteobacteria bacterium]|nr:hypothetical protein [Deltaproteobacteria bacterium]